MGRAGEGRWGFLGRTDEVPVAPVVHGEPRGAAAHEAVPQLRRHVPHNTERGVPRMFELASISHRQRTATATRIFPFKKRPGVRSDGGRSELD